MNDFVCVYMYICMCVYIYIYIWKYAPNILLSEKKASKKIEWSHFWKKKKKKKKREKRNYLHK